MGSDQSRQADPNGAEGPTDYYELLQVSEEATADEIKRSYRRLALLTHPDKVAQEKVEEATKMFADIQQAYEILMDPNERAFYDSHRNLPAGATDDDLFEHVRTNDTKAKPRFAGPGKPGVRLEQLLRFFDPKLARKMDDSADSFFSTYRSLFILLASDEADHTPGPIHFPPFGDSQSAYAPHGDIAREAKASTPWVRDFYAAWRDFSTEKRFEWVQKWDVERGVDRSMRRLMEKENKKLREEYRRDYNNTIRQLAAFIQARDPRYKAYRAGQARRKDTKSTSGAATPAEPAINGPSVEDQRRQAAEDFQEQDWQRIDALHLSSSDEEEDNAQAHSYECVACSKTFASEASWTNHEKSKRHKQAVRNLERQMRFEAEELGLELQDEVANQSNSEAEDERIDDQSADDVHPSTAPRPAGSPGKPNGVEIVSTRPDLAPSDEPERSTPPPMGNEKPRRAPKKRKAGKPTSDKVPGVPTNNLGNGRVDKTHQGDKPKAKTAKNTVPPVSLEAIEQKFQHVINDVESKRIKLGEKWGDGWPSISVKLRAQLGAEPRILCLGLGKPSSDRTAQIQLALLLLLVQEFEIPSIRVTAFDPVWDDLDKRVLAHFQISLEAENLIGRHVLDKEQSYLLYMPHCPKTLYQNILGVNFTARLCQPGRLLLGNDLAEYVDGGAPAKAAEDEAFVKPKKKRAGRNRWSERPRRDGVLERIVEHLDTLSLSSLPDTHLPGFARAFLSLSFQWLDANKEEVIDWSALPDQEMMAVDPETVVVQS